MLMPYVVSMNQAIYRIYNIKLNSISSILNSIVNTVTDMITLEHSIQIQIIHVTIFVPFPILLDITAIS